MRHIIPLVALCAVLSGCSHNLYIVGRTNHLTGTAKVTTQVGNKGGNIVIALGGKDYKGRWIYVQTGGSLGFGSATAFSGGQTATATGTMIGLPTGGNGSIIASAADGSSLHCAFDYSEWSNTGVGACQDDKGEMYDVQIN
jgi:hypothetical protein